MKIIKKYSKELVSQLLHGDMAGPTILLDIEISAIYAQPFQLQLCQIFQLYTIQSAMENCGNWPLLKKINDQINSVHFV